MSTLKVGIASYEEMKALTMAIARGQRKLAPREPRVWFPSTESFAKVLSAGNRDLLRTIAEKAPGSLEELAALTGRKKPNLSRTLKTMANYGLVRLERGPRGRIAPKVVHERIELELPLMRNDHAASIGRRLVHPEFLRS
jgi:predicted transcriptional regulator